jgi:hypothetical protein
MFERLPWNEISVPRKDFNVRHVAARTGVPCFWGRDSDGACLFIIELSGDFTVLYRKNAPVIHGIGLDLRSGEDERQRLVIRLEKESDIDLFTGFCKTLSVALSHAEDSSSALTIALTHIKRWKSFLSGKGARLSMDEVRGLFAELVFLVELLSQTDSEMFVIESWKGAEQLHQDFVFEDKAIEIKSLSGEERSMVRISSEDQLESLQEQLFLRTYKLTAREERGAGRSLNDLVDEIHSRLSIGEAIEMYEEKLSKRRYSPLPIYDKPTFEVGSTATYRIGPDFPRLIRSQLPEGITKVSYSIELEAIARFVCDPSCLFGGV